MERDLWNGIYQTVTELGNRHSTKGLGYGNAHIVLTLLWALLHDRPVSWACRPHHWPRGQRGRTPSPATMSRRLRTVGVLTLLEQTHAALRDRLPRSLCKWIDGKPLPVGGCSKDRDAKYGRAARGKARGYKLYAVCDAGGGLDAWAIGPMNVNEVTAARTLIRRVDGPGYLVADNQYDANHLYDAAAQAQLQLLTSRRKNVKALGHCRQSPHRLRGLALSDGVFGKALLHERGGIERFFAHLGNFAGGLGPLPNWVRTPRRVALWVQGKLIVNAVRMIKIKRLM